VTPREVTSPYMCLLKKHLKLKGIFNMLGNIELY